MPRRRTAAVAAAAAAADRRRSGQGGTFLEVAAASAPAAAAAAAANSTALVLAGAQHDALECCVCFDTPTAPRLLACCRKTTCTECLEQWLKLRTHWPGESRTAPCPHCRAPLDSAHQDLVDAARVERDRGLGTVRWNNLRSTFASFGWSFSDLASMAYKMAFCCRCPRCWRLVEKDGGCPHMTCPAPCNRSFIWSSPLNFVLVLSGFGLSMAIGNAIEAGTLLGSWWPIFQFAALGAVGFCSGLTLLFSVFVGPISSIEFINAPYVLFLAYHWIRLWGPVLQRWTRNGFGAFMWLLQPLLNLRATTLGIAEAVTAFAHNPMTTLNAHPLLVVGLGTVLALGLASVTRRVFGLGSLSDSVASVCSSYSIPSAGRRSRRNRRNRRT